MLKLKAMKTALRLVGIELSDEACAQLLIVCADVQVLIDIIKKEG